MKNMLQGFGWAVLAGLFSFHAQAACPSLDGHFVRTEDQLDTRFKTEKINGVYQYSITQDASEPTTLIADGKKHSVDGPTDDTSGSYVAHCDSKSRLVISLETPYGTIEDIYTLASDKSIEERLHFSHCTQGDCPEDTLQHYKPAPSAR